MTSYVRAALKRIPLMPQLVTLGRWVASPQLRAIRRLQRAPRSGLFQPSPKTMPDRYPQFFEYARSALHDMPTPRLLSYGCSTGDEVFSLHSYLPHAVVTGIDINPYSIEICRRRLRARPSPNIHFTCAASPEAEPESHYDAIFCMAVLRHGDLMAAPPDTCMPLFDFAKGEALVTALARCLKPGGLIVFWNVHFRFCDTRVAEQFDVVFADPRHPKANFPLYGADNRRLDVPAYCDAVFRKRGG